MDSIGGHQVQVDAQGRRYIDMTPSPAAYKAMLKVIINDGTVESERRWAKAELALWEQEYPDAPQH